MDRSDLAYMQRFADQVIHAQARYMEGLRAASDAYARQLETLRVEYEVDLAQALEQRRTRYGPGHV
jgi:hypothetical protein